MPTYGVALIFFAIPSYLSIALPPKLKLYIVLIIFIGTFLMPFFASLMLLRTGYLESLTVGTRKQRHAPYLLTFVFYCLTFYLLRTLLLPKPLLMIFLGITITVLIVFLINMKWKISAHMAGIGGLLGGVCSFAFQANISFPLPALAILFISGFLGFARIKLLSHTQAQVYTGFLLGFAVQPAMMFL